MFTIVIFFHLKGRKIINGCLSNTTFPINMTCRGKICFSIQKLEWEWQFTIKLLRLYSWKRNKENFDVYSPFVTNQCPSCLVLTKSHPNNVFSSNLCVKPLCSDNTDCNCPMYYLKSLCKIYTNF